MAQIKTFARLKPTKKPYPGYKCSQNVLTIEIPESKDMMALHNAGQHIRSNMSYDIVFSNIFMQEATQEEVFDGVAKDIIQNFLNGYNGTIFAYGQTGTGKTYTVEGNSCRYKSRGLATRALSMIYQQLEKRPDEHISVYLSYLEIYQEVAYDLLNPALQTMLPVIPFAKVTVVEGPRGSCIMRGLSLHLAANEEIAQMLLLQGQANRHVAETPVNQRSSRSHGVFSVYLQARKHDSQTIISSKLHLVDLAGSERVSKTGVDGQQLTEAKSINLSLHHLETVIISLQTEHRGSSADRERKEVPPTGSKSANSFMSHSSETSMRSTRYVPYRNSLLTMILRDSLGGNCLTAMIATISLEPENLGESISTCRFAQRVARIANYARRNEEVDDKILIKKLKSKVAELEKQVALLRSKAITGPVTDEDVVDVLSDQDRTICANVMEEYLQGLIHDPISAGICRVSQFRECLNLMKNRFQETGKAAPIAMIAGEAYRGEEETKGLAYHSLLKDGGDHAVEVVREEDLSSHAVRQSHSLHEIASNQSTQSNNSTFTSTSEPSINVSHASCIDAVSGLSYRANGHIPEKRFFADKSQVVRKKQSPPQTAAAREKELDDVDRLISLLGKGGNNGYKSPFERRREKEIKKLGRKLNSMGEEKMVKEEELETMKQDMVLQQLQMEEDGMQLKLQVSDEQVADQHAYLLQLKHLQADPDLITREMLVEKQLQKRQAKFRSKLDDIKERKVGVERELSQMHRQQPQQSSSRSKPSFEERFAQHKQSKGTLNTRQVFAMLKSEEKRQKKDVGNMEREKTIMKTRQLELKEIATLEKLRELKQILKMSQKYEEEAAYTPPAYESTENSLSNDNSTTNNSLKKPLSSLEGVEESHSVRSKHDVSVGSNTPVQINGQQGAWSEGNETPSASASEVIDKSGITTPSRTTSISSTGINQMPTSDGSATCSNSNNSGNKNVYSVNVSWAQYLSQNNNSLYQSSSLNVTSVNHEGGNNPAISQTNAKHSSYPSSSLVNKPTAFFDSSQVKPWDQSNNNDLKVKHSSEHSDEAQVLDDLVITDNVDAAEPLVGEPERVLQSNSSGKAIDSSQVTHQISPSSVVGGQDEIDLKTKDLELGDTQKRSVADILNSLKPSAVVGASNSRGDNTESQVQQSVLPPSEYINFMMANEGFDARRMGLSSRTFESALSYMLDSEESKSKVNVPDLPYRTDPYEKYTRSTDVPRQSHSTHTKKPAKYSVSHSSSYSSGKRHYVDDASHRERRKAAEKNPWGPESKKMSVADRLSGLLDTPSEFLPSADKGLQNDRLGEKSYEEESLQLRMENLEEQLERPTAVVEKDDSISDEDSFFGQVTPRTRIKALSGDEGEKTYMSRVAAEKERVAKIRKARHAAELIQKSWRKYKDGQ